MNMSKVEDLEKRIAELELKLNPPPAAPSVPSTPWQPRDFTENASPPIRRSEREQYRTDLTPEQARNEYSKHVNPVGRLTSLAEFLNKGPLPEPAPAVATTVPIGNVPGLAAIDRIAEGFAEREKLEALANQVDTLRKLKGL
jgi:hypothetical protein